jgi:hypothetical protein
MTTSRLRRALRVLGLGSLFVVTFVLATALHVGLSPGRRVAGRALQMFLDHTFLGSFTVGAVSELSPACVAVERFVARDPSGRVVLDANGVRARAYVLAIVRELLKNDGKTTIVIEYTRVEGAKVTLAPEATTGDLGIAAAFTPRPTPPKPSAPPGKPVRLWFGHAEIGDGAVHAELPGLPPLDGRATGVKGQVLVSPVGVAVDAARFSAVVHGLLAQDIRGVGTFHQRGTTHFWSTLDGYAGDLQFDSIARLDGKHLALKLDVPRGDPAVVRALLPSWPLNQTASAAVDATGDLPELQATASATVGPAVLSGHGTLAFSPDFRLGLSAHGDDIDLRALFPSMPETQVSADVELALTSSDRGLELTTNGSTKPAVVAHVPVPGTKFDASYGANGLAGRAELYEPGMPLSGTFALRDGAFNADVRAPRFELARAPRLEKLFGASGAAEFRAKAKISQNKLDATLALDLEHVTAGAGSLGSAHVAAHAAGPLASPRALRLDGSVDGRALRFAELRFDSLNAKVNGPLSKLAVKAKLLGVRGTSIEASSRVSPLGATRFDDVDVTISREGTSLHALAEHVTLTPDAIELADVRVEGAGGKLTGSARYRPTLLEVDARGEQLDLAAITRVFGFAGRRVRGKLDFTADLALARDVRRGSLELTLRDGAAGPLAGVSLDWSTALERENLEGSALLDVEGLGRARLTFDTRVEGSLLDVKAWRAATGHADLGLERLELGRVSPLLPRAWGLEALTGALVAQVMIEREGATDAPSVVVMAGTNGLGVTRHAPESEPLVVSGLDLELNANADSKRDFVLADLRVLDEHGLFAAASGRLDVGIKSLFERPSATWQGLHSAPVVATLVVDDRALDQLPRPLRPAGVLGTLRLELGLRGTLDEPRLSAKAAVARLAFGDAPEVVPFDACGTLQYDPRAQRAGLGLQAYMVGAGRACSGTRVAVASATLSVDAQALARGERGVSGEAQLGFEDFPLELVPPLAAAGVVGRVRGAAAVTDVSGAPALNARLSLADVSVHKIAVGSGDFTLRSNGPALTAGLKLERAHGTLDAEADAALDWSRNLPRFAATEPLGVRAEFHDMDASILLPVVGDVLGDLSGRLDGNAAFTLAGSEAKSGVTNDLSGNFTLQDGSLQISGLEMRLSKLGFAASASRVGNRTVVAVRDLSAASGSKYANVAGSADLYFSGIKLVDVRANVNLRRVPLMIQGVAQANLTGSAGVEVFPERDPILVAIQLHDLTAALPRTSGRAVLSVDDNPDITVAQPLREPLRGVKGNGPSFQLAFDLARKVRVTRADMEIPLHGRPVIDLGADTRVHGDLELESGGRAQLLGKGFVIESGEVHFDTADPADPHLRVLASWRAPDGTTVYVEVGGTVRQATLRLESDPALSQADIQALLLGGGGSRDNGQAQAAGLGYGADFVGQLLADTPLQRVELRTGTETTADDVSYSTYSAAVPVSENVWVELAYKSLEAGGATEQRDAASAIVDWRFKRDWSLRTEAGTVGAGLDMLWQYRY